MPALYSRVDLDQIGTKPVSPKPPREVVYIEVCMGEHTSQAITLEFVLVLGLFGVF